MPEYPKIIITKKMIFEAKNLISSTKINRTIASPIDTLTGNIGEMVFAQYYFNDWKKNNLGKNKGEPDFKNIEVKTSSFPFRDTLNLLVREDYAKKRKPLCYVQVIIDNNNHENINPGIIGLIGGWATSNEVDNAPLRDFGSKFGSLGGYKCHSIMIKNLRKIDTLKDYINQNE